MLFYSGFLIHNTCYITLDFFYSCFLAMVLSSLGNIHLIYWTLCLSTSLLDNAFVYCILEKKLSRILGCIIYPRFTSSGYLISLLAINNNVLFLSKLLSIFDLIPWFYNLFLIPNLVSPFKKKTYKKLFALGKIDFWLNE
jgi:hypothetical protein